jgi:hypothetical protein
VFWSSVVIVPSRPDARYRELPMNPAFRVMSGLGEAEHELAGTEKCDAHAARGLRCRDSAVFDKVRDSVRRSQVCAALTRPKPQGTIQR